ncbi:hypothetical protein AZE42_08988 [Rhizopogon vesiculosus]|uniref:Uncharacterized protein n=1 Tax=Rhizopogon vesiculosus TaxID=180088 RepID=A0A1J8Q607_9AGAM|nr:hypothetical protein AZE42_08988 [Rhizopogon vesiculosus]
MENAQADTIVRAFPDSASLDTITELAANIIARAGLRSS